MTSVDTILFIRDEMLSNPYSNASKIYDISRLAEEDSKAFELMKNWMYETNNKAKNIIINEIEDYLYECGL